MKVIVNFTFLLANSTSLYSQNGITPGDLDSLYYKFLLVHNLADLKIPSPSQSIDVDRKCGFALNAEMKFYMNLFSAEQQKIIKRVLSRPVLQTSIVSKSGKFRIHFDETGTNKPSYLGNLSAIENAQLVADAFDSSYSYEVVYLKYPRPPDDDNEGGDNLYDVYIENLGNGNYGETIGGSLNEDGTMSSFIKIENDFGINQGYFTNGINAANVTAAHELHHAIQMGNYVLKLDQRYFHEFTSTSMEEFVFDSVNDYYGYINNFFYNPAASFSKFTYPGAIYGQALWNIFLFERYGAKALDMIKRQWELFRQLSALEAVNLSLSENQVSFKQALHEFGLWCYLTGYRKNYSATGLGFSEGENYPLLKPNYIRTFSPAEDSYPVTTKPMSNNYIKILSNNGTYFDTILTVITNSDFSNGLANPGNDYGSTLDVFNYEAQGSQKIANNYFSRLSAENDAYYSQSSFFNNRIDPEITTVFITENYAFPNPFRYSSQKNIFIPVEYNGDMHAILNIYSIDMNLVYTSDEKIKILMDKFVLSWNGFDNNAKKLPTGVYIYISNSDDKLKKGKLVIYND